MGAVGMECHGVDELLPGLALGAVTLNEQANLERHLATCDHHEQWADFQRVAGMLTLTVQQVNPPTYVKQRQMARVYRDLEPRFGARGGFRWAWGWVAAAAMALVALGLGVRDYTLSGQLSAAPMQWQLQPASAEVRSSGTLVWLPSQQAATLTLQQLPVLPGGAVYEVWLIKAGTPSPAGVFQPAADNSASVLVKGSLPDYDTLAITREPGPAGSQAPTSAPFVAAKLR